MHPAGRVAVQSRFAALAREASGCQETPDTAPSGSQEMEESLGLGLGTVGRHGSYVKSMVEDMRAPVATFVLQGDRGWSASGFSQSLVSRKITAMTARTETLGRRTERSSPVGWRCRLKGALDMSRMPRGGFADEPLTFGLMHGAALDPGSELFTRRDHSADQSAGVRDAVAAGVMNGPNSGIWRY